MKTRRPYHLLAMHGSPCVGAGCALAASLAVETWQGQTASAALEGRIGFESSDPTREDLSP